MITTTTTIAGREVDAEQTDRGFAVFSTDRTKRYLLQRYLTPETLARRPDLRRNVTFVMVNPSTADAFTDDNTIRKCMKFARTWGARDPNGNIDTLTVVNLFALRAREPAEIKKAGSAEAAGHDAINDWMLAHHTAPERTVMTIAAWGTNGAHYDRHIHVRGEGGALHGVSLHHLGLTDDLRYPRHPLYRPDATVPELWIP